MNSVALSDLRIVHAGGWYWFETWLVEHRRGWHYWQYPVKDQDGSKLYVCGREWYGPPPSETLKTLIAAGAPWYAVLDKFVEEYPQWEEVLTWAPQGVAE